MYPLIDLLRFFAALLVVSLHLIATKTMPSIGRDFGMNSGAYDKFYVTAPSVFFYGYIGVQVFFLISGFIINLSAEKSASAFEFIKGRSLRIFPALWICTILSFLLLLVWTNTSFTELAIRAIKSLVLFPKGPHIDGVIWTIIVEMVFYFLVFFTLCIFGMKGLHRLPILLVIASSTYLIICWVRPDIRNIWIVEQVAEKMLFEHGVYFGLGMLYAKVDNGIAKPIKVTLTIVGLIAIYIQLRFTNDFIFARYGVYGASSDIFLPFIAVLLSLLIIRIRFNVSQKNHAGRICRQIGLVTYPLYLLHSIVGVFVFAWLDQWIKLPIITTLVLMVYIVILISLLISEKLEPKVKIWLQFQIENLMPHKYKYRDVLDANLKNRIQ